MFGWLKRKPQPPQCGEFKYHCYHRGLSELHDFPVKDCNKGRREWALKHVCCRCGHVWWEELDYGGL